MWLLALDTSSKDSSVALFRDGELVSLVAPPLEEPQGVAVFRWVERAFEEAGITPADAGAFAVVTGPGAFTGLRVGLSLVKGMAEPRNLPVVAVGTLEAVCQAGSEQGLLAPLVDARRGQVFAGLYRRRNGELARVAPPRLLTLEEFLDDLGSRKISPRGCAFVSPNRGMWEEALHRTPFAASRLETIAPVLAEAVGRCALRKLERGETTDTLNLKADYLRRSDAELLWKSK